MSILNTIVFDASSYQATLPYPYGIQDGFLDAGFAEALQGEILAIPSSQWDRYQNPFEAKYTLRDKRGFPPLLNQLFGEMESPAFVEQIGAIVGEKLYTDTTRNFWGVHLYEPGDKLDIHVDAGIHPALGLKKQVTLGIYLSANWKEEYGCHLEVWRGENAKNNDTRLLEKVASIAPIFNRLVLFTCNDYAWHGNPEPACGPAESRRIFVTISYLSENYSDENKRMKAFFVARPGDPVDAEKDRLRLLRADPERYKEVYKHS
jgi:hypothetical protein